MERDPDHDGFCGDGIVQVENGEECDDGNKVVTDGCVSEYQVKKGTGNPTDRLFLGNRNSSDVLQHWNAS